jgi:hypothetical protein
MNQVVRLGDRVVRQGVLAIVLSMVCVSPCAVMGQQQGAPVPDAPTPQQPDSLGKLTSGMTPGKGSQEPAPDQGTNTTQVPPASKNPMFPRPENYRKIWRPSAPRSITSSFRSRYWTRSINKWPD